MGTSKRKIDNKLFANEGAQSTGTQRPMALTNSSRSAIIMAYP